MLFRSGIGGCRTAGRSGYRPLLTGERPAASTGSTFGLGSRAGEEPECVDQPQPIALPARATVDRRAIERTDTLRTSVDRCRPGEHPAVGGDEFEPTVDAACGPVRVVQTMVMEPAQHDEVVGMVVAAVGAVHEVVYLDRKSTRLNSSH